MGMKMEKELSKVYLLTPKGKFEVDYVWRDIITQRYYAVLLNGKQWLISEREFLELKNLGARDLSSWK